MAKKVFEKIGQFIVLAGALAFLLVYQEIEPEQQSGAGEVSVDSRASDYAVFGHPGDAKIEDKTISLIDDVGPGGEITMAIYYLSDVEAKSGRKLSVALICAAKRNVKIRILTEARFLLKHDASSSKDDDMRSMIQYLSDRSHYANVECSGQSSSDHESSYPSIDIGVCYYGCAWGKNYGSYDRAIQHNKFILIEDQGKTIVVQSSSNYSKSQQNSYQDMVVIHDNQALFDAYMERFEFLLTANRTHSPASYSVSEGGRYKVRFFPQGECQDGAGKAVQVCGLENTDAVLSFLRPLNPSENCHLYFNMYIWSNSKRSNAIADKAISLARQGCRVNVLVNPKHIHKNISRKLSSAKNVKLLTRKNIHSKYILLKADDYAGEEIRRVWMGSHNFTNVSLRRNDEAILQIDDDGIFNAYLMDWNIVANGAK